MNCVGITIISGSSFIKAEQGLAVPQVSVCYSLIRARGLTLTLNVTFAITASETSHHCAEK